MPASSFAYEARDKVGNTLTGQVQAESREVVARQLRDQGYTVLRNTEQEQSVAGPRPVRPGIGARVPLNVVAQFYRELATLVGAGMTVIQSLHTLEDTTLHPTLRWALRGMLTGVERGQRLSDNMKRFPEVFSPLAVAIVAAGEHGGRLDDMLKLMAEYSERDMETQRMVNRETFYPKILLVALLTIVPFGLAIATGIASGAAAGFTMVAKILLCYLVFLGLPIVLIVSLFRALRKSEQGRVRMDRVKLALPIFGSLANRIAMSRFCRALGALYSAGIALPEGVGLAADTLGNAALAAGVTRTIPQLQHGAKLSDALAQSNLTPQLVLSMLRTGEQTGNVDQVLLKVADYYDDETKTKIHQLGTTIVPICVVLAGIIVLFVAISFFTPFYGAMLSSQ